MANSLFRLQMIGHLGSDAKVSFTPDGKKVCSFSVAANRSWTNAEGNKVEKTHWANCTIWSEPLIDSIVQYLVKGKQVLVEGRPGVSAYLGKEDHLPKASLELAVREIQLLGNGQRVEVEEPEEPVTDGVPF